MPRGTIPRQPSRSGRHEGAHRQATRVSSKTADTRSSHLKTKPTPTSATTTKPGANGSSRKARSPRIPASPKSSAKNSRHNPTAPERVSKIIAGLDEMYPGVTCALTHRSAWELLVATILSAQSTDVRVNKVTPDLFKKYPTVEAFAALEPEQLQPDIYSTGFFRNKAKSVVGAARKIVSEFAGKVPETMDELLTLPGVARKTANVVLGTWFKQNEGVVVDTHVTRIAYRLELTPHEEAKKIEEDLMKVIPRERWTDFSHEVIWHGRKLCVARGPKCVDCKIEPLCHAADKTWSTVAIHKSATP
jgi:endonuclease III